MKKSYYFIPVCLLAGADSQILVQREHAADPNFYDEYFYVHDRLGSVCMVVKYNAGTNAVNTVHSYGYTPFGRFYAADTYETAAEADNPFKFTGQWYDDEISQYYLRARQYSPEMMRFTARDSVAGTFAEPMTLHKYLYCVNDPINRFDPDGNFALPSFLTANSIVSKMRGSIAGFSGRLASLGAKIYTEAMARVCVWSTTIYMFYSTGRLDLGAFRSEWGSWGPAGSMWQNRLWYHFHLDLGPGLWKHHLPYELTDWMKNFMAVYGKGS